MEIEGELTSRLPGLDAAEPDWDAVYAREVGRVLNFFRYRFGDETLAEDLTSLTFEKAWKARRRYRRDLAGFGTWLLSIARNVAIDHFRAARRDVPLDESAAASGGGTPEDASAAASDIARLAVLLEYLPRRDREVLALKYGAEATNRTIARLTGLSESNVGTIVHRAVQRLRELW